MPRFYFHISSADQENIPDCEGMELRDLDAAHHRACHIVDETMRWVDQDSWRGWRVRVADDAGRTALVVLYPANAPVRRWFGKRAPSRAAIDECGPVRGASPRPRDANP